MRIGPAITGDPDATRRFVARVRVGGWLTFAGLLGFTLAGPLLTPDYPGWIGVVDAIELSGCLGLLAVLPRVRTYEGAVRVTLGGVVVLSITTAVSGAIIGDAQGAPVLLVLLSMGTATLLAWGVRAQLLQCTAMALAALGSIHVHPGIGNAVPLVGAILVGALKATYMAGAFERSREERHRAEAAIAEARARRHQAEIAQAARLSSIGGMAASLAHELNQPLGAIATYAQGMIRRLHAGDVDRATLLGVATAIERQAMRASEVLQAIREFVRHREPRHEPVDVNVLVRAAMQLADFEAREQGVHVALDLVPEPLPIHGDGVQIEQVILNLAQNALDAMRDNDGHPRELVIATRPGDGHAVEVAVRDTGPGMTRSSMAAVGTPFVTTKPSGLGLGLAISRAIVEAHGGRLWATANPERGTTVHFTLRAA